MREYTLEAVRTRLGMIVLSTDTTLEDEARQVLAGQAVSLLHSRIEFKTEVTPETLRDMQALMPEAARLLPEELTSIAYGCTSASVMIGPDVVADEIGSVHPGVPVTNPISAVIKALETLGTRRIGLVTPYPAAVAGPMRSFLAERGVETLQEISFGESDDRKVARIAEASTLEAVLEAGAAPGVEAVFVSCTNVRAFGIIEEAESALGVPVISSNLALIWDALRLGGVPSQGWGPGRLFEI